jgi:hypothetical protein
MLVSFRTGGILSREPVSRVKAIQQNTRTSVSLAVDALELSSLPCSSLGYSGSFRASLGAKSRSVKAC